MESKYQLMTKDFEFKLSALQLEKDKSDDKLRAFEKKREEIIKENTRLRSVINETESLRNELEREQEKSRELSRKVQKLETEIGSNMSLEHELSEINNKSANSKNLPNKKIRSAQLCIHIAKLDNDQKHTARNFQPIEYDKLLSKFLLLSFLTTRHFASPNGLSRRCIVVTVREITDRVLQRRCGLFRVQFLPHFYQSTSYDDVNN